MTRRLADVAQQVGVSQATVSRVLNDKPGVSDATRQTVLTALDVLGYERPAKLRGERARLVGLVLPELQNPIFPALAEVISAGLAQHGLTPVLCTLNAAGITETEYVDLLLSQQVSGVIFAGGQYARRRAEHGHYRLLAERNLPVVLMNAAIDHLPFPGVVCDDDAAIEQALGHLHALGHDRIGLLLGPADHVPSERKLEAARAVAERLGMALPAERIVRSDYAPSAGQAAAARLLRQGVTGIACASDPLALGAIRAARRAGLEVPTDVSIVGYDDSPLMAMVDPPLTTVRQPIEQMGTAAIGLLVGLLDGLPVEGEDLVFDPELVVRGSTGRPPQ